MKRIKKISIVRSIRFPKELHKLITQNARAHKKTFNLYVVNMLWWNIKNDLKRDMKKW